LASNNAKNNARSGSGAVSITRQATGVDLNSVGILCHVASRYFITILFKDLTPLSLHPQVEFIPLRLGISHGKELR
jgi:hypothetical protein